MENWKKRLKKFHNGIIKRGECRAEQEGFLCCLEKEGVIDFISKELDKAREEGRESIIAELSISESMERVEGFFREAPVDYDDKCNLWNDFLSKLKQ